ncbi:MAG: hypothetical protein ABIQ72_18350 [Usitatibacter sp.]
MAVALAIARDHPAYSGHFPSQPILPGVVLLAEVLAAIELATGKPTREWEISNAKFLAPVTPGMALTLVHSATNSGSLRFEVRSAQDLVASGVLSHVAS